MRRTGEGPEGAPPGGRLLVPLVVAGAAVVVLSAVAEGRAHVTPFSTSSTPEPGGFSEAPPASLPTNRPLGDAPQVGGVLQTALLVLAGVVAVVVAVLLIRALLAALRDRQRRAGRPRLRSLDGEAEVADAPTVLRGIAAALVALDEDREPGDAVVRAWLGLQQAAEDAGFARSAAETPTEFTGRVLSRTGADRAALGTLLRLYLRARFGDAPITEGDAGEARAALRALEASWERATSGSRG